MRVLNSLLSFYDGLEGLTEGTLYYIERRIAQVVENQVSDLYQHGAAERDTERIKGMGSWIKKNIIRGIYVATRKKKHNDAQKNWISDSSDRSNGVSDFLKTDKGGEHE